MAKSQPADTQTLAVAQAPAWLHPETARALRRLVTDRGRLEWAWSFGLGERASLRHRKPIPVSLWAERHRVVHVSSLPGPWRNQVTPYAAAIMDSSFYPSVGRISIMKCPQSGGTEAVHNCVAYAIDRAPGPVLYVYPDEATARENAQDRIIPMLHASPRLREYLTGMSDDLSSLRVKLAHLTIYMAWSGSPARLGNKPIRYLVMDELDKYQDTKREASAEALAEKRVITWGRRAKIWKLSTPTVPDAPIARAFNQSEAKFRYFVICPYCGCELLMDFERIGWPEDCDDPVKLESRSLGFYACQHCDARWNDADRDLAVRKGLWRDEASGLAINEHLARHNPISLGFHIPAWISPFNSLSKIASVALSYRLKPELQLLKDLRNNYKAEPWEAEFEKRDEEKLLELCDDRPRGAVPGPLQADGKEAAPRVSCLLAGVDTQKDHFYYVIRAFGFGELTESWLVQAGTVGSLEALDQLLWQNVYAAADGSEHQVKAAMIDAMGSRTAEIYRYAIKRRGQVYPWMGKRSMSQPYTPRPQEYYPDTAGNKVKIPGGMNLWLCDVTFFKNDLAHRLTIHPADPGAFHLHSNDKGELDEYGRQMCAEIYDEKEQAWLNPRNRPNHYWDCEVMVNALAYIRNVAGRRPQTRRRPKVEALRGDPPAISTRLGRWSR